MAEDEAGIAAAAGSRPEDVFPLAEGEQFATEESSDRGPTEDTDREHHVVDTRTEDRGERDDDDQRGEREEDVGHSHHERIDPTTVKPGQRTEGDPDRGV